MSLLCLGGLIWKFSTSEALPEGTLTEKRKQFSELPDAAPPQVELPAIVQEINARNAKVKSLACENLDIKVWQNGLRYKLTGRLYSEKPTMFRMQIDSILGSEVDIGSNDKLFWYWSRRDKNPGVHYASYADYNKTRLKTPFNPLFMRSTLGIEHLPNTNVKVTDNGKDIMLTYPRENASGQPILFSVFINKERKHVDGFLVTDMKGKTLAACEIQEYNGDIPVKILYSWYEENKVLLMTLNRPQLNATISPTMWQMPNIQPKLNMAEDF
jgi:outer membrane lipoprotein-sorting protein